MSVDNGGVSPGVGPSAGSGVRAGTGGSAAEPTPVPADIERSLGQIAGIRAARIVADPSGRIAEVHVLAEPGRSPKQVVRDIQSAVLTSFGLSIDYRVVSVVQLERETGVARAAGAPRPILRRLSAETASYSTEVKVGLSLVDGEEVARTMRGPATAGLRLVAQATVDAVVESITAEAVEVESALVIAVGSRQIAMVLLRVMTGRGDHVVVGSAVVRRDPADAVARASLDALNRFIGAV